MNDSGSTRKRANVACTFCRRRKRRCDGLEPSCTLCQNSGRSCVYDSTELHKAKPDPPSSDVQERLSNVEALLEQCASTIEKLTASQPSQVPTTPLHQSPEIIVEPGGSVALSPVGVRDWVMPSQSNAYPDTPSPALSYGRELPPMVIPRGHSTTTASLLSCDSVKAVLGDFPPNLFISKEAERGWPGGPPINPDILNLEDLPRIHPSDTQPLLESYFTLAHPEFPILNPDPIFRLHDRVLANGLQENTGSALLLVILAIGCIVTEPVDIGGGVPETDHLSLNFIRPALRILCHEALNTFGTSIELSQALFLAAKFYGYLLRPLQSWKLVHMASTNIQHLCNQEPDPDWESANRIALTAWAIFDTECDLIAEHQLPRSGIEHVVDAMPLPKCLDQNSDATFSFLAELSARRLLNRVHHNIYDNNSTTLSLRVSSPSAQAEPFSQQPVPAVMKLSSELDRQLEVWFNMLPPTLKPQLHDTTSRDGHKMNILHRYHSAKDIIFRPFVMYAWTLPFGQQLPNQVMDCCKTCILNCRSYLLVAADSVDMIRSNREIIIHSILAVTIVLSLSALCPLLEHAIADIGQVQQKAISAVENWALPGSSIEDILAILRFLQSKVQILKARRRHPRDI